MINHESKAMKSFCPIGDEWAEHREDSIDAMRKVTEMHGTITVMAGHTSHLSKLDSIANTLERLEDSLVGPATGKKQVSLVSHLITIFMLGAVILVVLLKGSDKEVSVGLGGISIHKAQ